MKNLILFFRVIGLFIKHQFVCLHLPSDLKVTNFIEKTHDDGEFETWMCLSECTKCGEKSIPKQMIFSKRFLKTFPVYNS